MSHEKHLALSFYAMIKVNGNLCCECKQIHIGAFD